VLRGDIIHPLTDIGEATATILKFNGSERVVERETLRRVGRYPTNAALKRMRE